MQIAVSRGQTAHYHVGITDRFNFVDVERFDDGVEAGVQIVE